MLMLDLTASAVEIAAASRRDIEELCIALQQEVTKAKNKTEAEYERGYDNGFEEGQQMQDCDDCDAKDRRLRIFEGSRQRLKEIWLVKGEMPEHHDHMIALLSKDWPVLHNFIVAEIAK